MFLLYTSATGNMLTAGGIRAMYDIERGIEVRAARPAAGGRRRADRSCMRRPQGGESAWKGRGVDGYDSHCRLEYNGTAPLGCQWPTGPVLSVRARADTYDSPCPPIAPHAPALASQLVFPAGRPTEQQLADLTDQEVQLRVRDALRNGSSLAYASLDRHLLARVQQEGADSVAIRSKYVRTQVHFGAPFAQEFNNRWHRPEDQEEQFKKYAEPMLDWFDKPDPPGVKVNCARLLAGCRAQPRALALTALDQIWRCCSRASRCPAS